MNLLIRPNLQGPVVLPASGHPTPSPTDETAVRHPFLSNVLQGMAFSYPLGYHAHRHRIAFDQLEPSQPAIARIDHSDFVHFLKIFGAGA